MIFASMPPRFNTPIGSGSGCNTAAPRTCGISLSPVFPSIGLVPMSAGLCWRAAKRYARCRATRRCIVSRAGAWCLWAPSAASLHILCTEVRTPHSAIRQTRSEGRRRRRKAPSISPNSAPALPATLSVHSATLRSAQRRRSATGATVCPTPGQEPHHHRSAATRC
jgi:hypothetical protein